TADGVPLHGGPAAATVSVQSGVLSSCGTILGRVFVDLNGDGRPVDGDPGVANAVIVLDDGTRITTDSNGLFHVACTSSGWRTGTLDLTSIPGYEPAPNLYFVGQGGASILVHLEPGGLVRMNFAVRKKVVSP
ncbi:MAG TPA: hypothetical protein VEJ20_08485, partial [Candidatus Eremiobacteraceae bacterium]|nr:hypothetical protein [Candidatus Eremiobacteraceae bacterium]